MTTDGHGWGEGMRGRDHDQDHDYLLLRCTRTEWTGIWNVGGERIDRGWARIGKRDEEGE